MRTDISGHARLGASGGRLPTPTEPLETIAGWLARFDLSGWVQIAAWKERLQLSVEDVLLLFAVTSDDGPSSTSDLADVSGLSRDAAFRTVRDLRGRGYLCEQRRMYSLSAVGQVLVNTLEAAHHKRIQAYVDNLHPRERQRLDDALGTTGD